MLDDLLDLAGQILADTGQSGQILICLNHGAHLPAGVAERAGGVAVGSDAKDIRALDLQQIRDLIEDQGDVRGMDGHGRARRTKPGTVGQR